MAKHEDPRQLGQGLRVGRYGEFWKRRAGQYRIAARIEDAAVRVPVVRIGHRSAVYR